MEETTSFQSHEDLEQQIEKLRKILRNPLCRPMEREWIKTSESASGKKGGQGMVVVGTLVWPLEWEMTPPELTVAVKKLHWNLDDPNATIKLLKSFVNEAKLRSTLIHPNIAFLLGCMEDVQNGDAWLITPWEANGNVREFLQSGEWDIPERISLLYDVANGVEYLHSQEPPICHGDLKSLNILVNSQYRAVITDFGSARNKPRAEQEKKSDLSKLPLALEIEGKMTTRLASLKVEFDADNGNFTLTGPGFSLRWTAPEVLENGTQDSDLPSDMWALGWISWEIVTGRIPFDELNRDGAIISHTINGKLPPIREHQQLAHVLQLCSIMSDCWIAVPMKRIEASTVRQKISMMPYTTPSSTTRNKQKERSSQLLDQLGMMYGVQGEIKNAEMHCQQALEVATRTKDGSAQAHALNSLGSVYSAQSRSSEAEQALKDSNDIYSRIGDDHGAANALNNLGYVYCHQSKINEAEKTFLDAHAIHSRIGNDLGAANALSGLADVNRLRSRGSEAEKAFLEAHANYSRICNDLGAAHALNGLGNVYLSQSKINEAEKAFLDARAIHSRMGHDLGSANALFSLGEVYRAHSRYGEAEKALLEAHAIQSRIRNDHGAANALNRLANVYRLQSNYNKAGKAFMDAQAIHSRIGDQHGTAHTFLCLGHLYNDQRQFAQAEETLLKALELYTFINDNLGVGNTLRCLAIVLLQQRRSSEAESYCSKAVSAYGSIDKNDERAKALSLLGLINIAQGRYLDAENAMNEALAIFISIGDEVNLCLTSVQLAFIPVFETSSECDETMVGSLQQLLEVFTPRGLVIDDVDLLRVLGDLCAKHERYADAEEHYSLLQAVCMSSGDVGGEAEALARLGTLYFRQNQYDLAEEHFVQARVAFAFAVNDEGEAEMLDRLMGTLAVQRKYDLMRSYCMDACEMYSCLGKPMSEMCSKAWELLQALEDLNKPQSADLR